MREDVLSRLSDLIWIHGFGTVLGAVAPELRDGNYRVRLDSDDFHTIYRVTVRDGVGRVEHDVDPETPCDFELCWALNVSDVRDLLEGHDILARAFDTGTLRLVGTPSGAARFYSLVDAVFGIDWRSLFTDPAATLTDRILARLERANHRRSLGLSGRNPQLSVQLGTGALES